MNVILQLYGFFERLMGFVVKVGFGPKEAIAMTAVFMVIAALRVLYLWIDFAGSEGTAYKGITMFAKAQFKNLVVWFLVAGSPVLFSSLAKTVSGRVVNTAAPIAAEGQKVFTTALDTLGLLWEVRSAANVFIRHDMNLDAPAIDAKDGINAADTSLQNNLAKGHAQADAMIERGKKLQLSKDPAQKQVGTALEQDGLKQKSDLAQAQANILARKVIEGEEIEFAMKNPGLYRATNGIKSTLKQMYAPGITIVELSANTISFIASLLVVGPAMFLLFGALMKIIQSMMEVFSFVFGFIAMIMVVGAFSVGLAPLAMVSFISDQWSKYGWNFVGFWLQAVVASLALGAMTTVAAKGVGELGGLIGTCGLLVTGSAFSNQNVVTMAINCLMAGLMFLGVGAALSFITTLLQKGLSGAVGMVNGSLHP